MKVFRIRPDIDRYQTIDSVSGFVKKHPPTRPYAKLLKDWEPIELPVDDPKKPRGDFLYFPLEYLVCSRSVAKAFEECVREDVQALPVGLKGDDGSYELWNITNFVEAMDVRKTKFMPPPFRSIPEVWVFDAKRLERPMLFRDPRIPGMPLVVTFGAQTHDFYSYYSRQKMSGLSFELVWKE